VNDVSGHDAAQRISQLRDLLGDDIQTEGFDGDESITLRVICAEYRSQHAAPNLVQHAEGSECGRRGESVGLVERQRCTPRAIEEC